jgi:septum formation protein
MNSKQQLILASSSPRRQYIMKEAGFDFKVIKPDVDESFPENLPVDQVARYLASKKAEYFRPQIRNEIVITADTIVLFENRILNKPANKLDALTMLKSLNGNTHLVITGVCILSAEKEIIFDDASEVSFNKLTESEIEYYIDIYKPYDKAGSYGAQDWIGMVGIQKINGSYFNVMGLPIHKVYQELKKFGISSSQN